MTRECPIRWKGALYGINYESWQSCDHSSHTLLQLCSQVIVHDASFTRVALAALPYNLHYSLMRAAIERGRHCSVKALLEAWPSRLLSISVLMPHYHRSGQLLYDRLLYSTQLENAVHLTTLLIHTFIMQVVQQPSDQQLGRLKILDLTGFPVVEPVLQLVIRTIAERHSHYNCHKKETSDKLEVSDTKCPHLTTKECACEPYIIRMDCFIRDSSVFDKLLHALTVCRSSKSHLKLEVTKINAVCLGVRQVAKLLKLLDPEVIQGMGLEYNAFCNEGLVHLGLEICKFSNLTALDLSCNNLKLSRDGQVCSSLGQVLQCLTKLERLDLSNNKLSGALATLLSHLALSNAALEYLKLSACQLKDEDLESLARCPSIRALRDLDLSENFFGSKVEWLIRLLENLRKSLQVLELEDCGFTGAQLPNLVGSICQLWSLRYLNIARNKLTMADLCQGLPNLQILPQLQCVRLSSSCTWLDQVSDSPFENERTKRRKVECAMQDSIKHIHGPLLVVWDDQCFDD